jgi:hypothetical protein
MHTGLTVCLLLSSQDCIGAIDGTHVTARVPKSQSAAYRGRKYYTIQNVLAVVDFDLKFTYVLAGWEGSAHDASNLTDRLSRLDDIHFPDGRFYLGDAGYACHHESSPLQENQVSSDKVLSKKQTTECRGVVQS